MVTLAFLFPALGGLLFGFDIGATSGAIISITSPEHSGTSWWACPAVPVMRAHEHHQTSDQNCVHCRYDLSSFQSGAVVSSSLFGALGGSVLAFLFGDKLGRKRELLLAALCYGESLT